MSMNTTKYIDMVKYRNQSKADFATRLQWRINGLMKANISWQDAYSFVTDIDSGWHEGEKVEGHRYNQVVTYTLENSYRSTSSMGDSYTFEFILDQP